MRAVVVALVLMCGLSAAHAEKDLLPWYRGKYGRNRIFHLSVTGSLAAVYLAQVTVLRTALLPEACRWCDPPGFDKAARDAVVWRDVKRANFLSNVTAYAISPLVGATLLVISDHDASMGRLIDDLLPAAEALVTAQVVVGFLKLFAARNRPSVYYGDTRYPKADEDILSFPSGHSSFGFAVTTAAGMVCHFRQYWTEPYVWGAGIAMSLTTEYLRMAADRHWMSDVLTGGLVGIGAGILIPRLMRRDIKLAPVPGGAAVVGVF